MEIHDLTPVHDPGGRDVAMFAVKPTSDIKLCGLRLRRAPDGSYRTVAPRAFDACAMHFAPALFHEITNAAAAAFERHHAIGRPRN